MIKTFSSREDIPALQAKHEAQKIAFGAVSFQAAVAMRDLGILEYLFAHESSGATQSEIAKNLNLTEYGVRVLLEMGLSLDLVKLEGDKYFPTKTAFFILRDDLTRVNINFIKDVCYLGLDRLKESIVSGKPEGLKVFGDWPTIYEGLSQLPPQARKSWLEFDHYYSDRVFDLALPIVFATKPKMLFDIGGNTGKWTLKCLDYDPEVHVTIVDLPGQIAMAKETFANHPHAARIHFHAANMLSPDTVLPKGADIIWMSQFLDCFSESEIVDILTKAKNALAIGSRVVINETFWDHQKYEAAAFSLHATSLYFTAMANGNSQMYHSDLFIQLIEKAGLKVEKVDTGIGVSHSIITCLRVD